MWLFVYGKDDELEFKSERERQKERWILLQVDIVNRNKGRKRPEIRWSIESDWYWTVGVPFSVVILWSFRLIFDNRTLLFYILHDESRKGMKQWKENVEKSRSVDSWIIIFFGGELSNDTRIEIIHSRKIGEYQMENFQASNHLWKKQDNRRTKSEGVEGISMDTKRER